MAHSGTPAISDGGHVSGDVAWHVSFNSGGRKVLRLRLAHGIGGTI